MYNRRFSVVQGQVPGDGGVSVPVVEEVAGGVGAAALCQALHPHG